MRAAAAFDCRRFMLVELLSNSIKTFRSRSGQGVGTRQTGRMGMRLWFVSALCKPLCEHRGARRSVGWKARTTAHGTKYAQRQRGEATSARLAFQQAQQAIVEIFSS